MRPLLPLLLSSFLAAAASAQTPYLVTDLNTLTAEAPSSSNPKTFFRLADRILFTTATPERYALYATDGTEAGTQFLAALGSEEARSPRWFAALGGAVVFNGRDDRGPQLWISDGTPAGTRLLAPLAANARPGEKITFGNAVLFSAAGADGRELWITDGTAAGTRMLKDLTPGAVSSDPAGFVLFQQKIYFSAGGALWRSDGTEGGTVIVKSGIAPGQLVVAGQRLFFRGHSVAHGFEPWVSDGTEEGTQLLLDITPGAGSSSIGAEVAFGERLLFTADREGRREPWISDGTAAGTHVLPGFGGGDTAYNAQYAVVGAHAYFVGTTPGEGVELWKTDGVKSEVLTDHTPPGQRGGGFFSNLTSGVDRLYFSVRTTNDPAGRLWVTDGTSAGTRSVQTSARHFVADSSFSFVDGRLYFAGSDGLTGFEPWVSDGGSAGTKLIVNLEGDRPPSSAPGEFVVAGDQLFFAAWDGIETASSGWTTPRSLFRTDGTAGGTIKLLSRMPEATAVGRSILFRENDSWWMSDGTPAGTKPAEAFGAQFESDVEVAGVWRETIFVHSADRLWATRLAPAGPPVDLGPRSAAGFRDVAGRVFFVAESFYSGPRDLLSSDGTAEGTYTVAREFDATTIFSSVAAGQYFMSEPFGSRKLWRSDGTAAGTFALNDGSASAGTDLVAAGRNLFFIAGGDLWVTDGTVAGTRILPAKPEGTPAAAGDKLVFVNSNEANGRELWVSDGTVEGTRLLTDIHAGSGSAFIEHLRSAGPYAFFSAYDGMHGAEPWITDGTAAGTRMLADLNAGQQSSTPRDFAHAANRVYFSATTSTSGTELWAVELPSPRLRVSDVRLTESAAGGLARFRIELSAPSSSIVSVGYKTTDVTATAGADYTAVSGSVTFTAGQTLAVIDVPVTADAVMEGDESFVLALHDAAGAMLERQTGAAVIEDDDRVADLATSLDFSTLGSQAVTFVTRNHGPAVATNVHRAVEVTPGRDIFCQECVEPQQLAPGEELRRAVGQVVHGVQQYQTVRAGARERDPNPANDAAGCTLNGSIAMDALWLAPGTTGTVWFAAWNNPSEVTIVSSDPSVVSVPATLTLSGGAPASFVARALKAGSALIRVHSGASEYGLLKIDVLPPGERLRWPGGIDAYPSDGTLRFDEEGVVHIRTDAVAPFTGAHATGDVVIRANGVEVARTTLTAERRAYDVAFRLPDVGPIELVVEYEGNADFLPERTTWNLTGLPGFVTVTGAAVRDDEGATIRVSVAGSPVRTPSGTIVIREAGRIADIESPLVPTDTPGVAAATFELKSISAGAHTLEVIYSGDARYRRAEQNIRILDGKRRAVAH